MSDPRPVNVDGCLPAPLRGALDQLAQNDQFLIQLQNFVTQLGDQIKKKNNFGTAKLGGKKPQFFQDAEETFGILPDQQRPMFKVELTSDVNASTGLATAKLLAWNNTAYATSGDDYDVYEVFRKYRNGRDGDQGWIGWDAQRMKWIILSLNTPMTRIGTLGASLSSGAGSSASFTDTHDSAAITNVYGNMVPSGQSLASGTMVVIAWFPKVSDGMWIVISANACAT